MTVLPWMKAPLVAVCSDAFSAANTRNNSELFSKSPLIHDSTPQLPGHPPGWPEWFAAAGWHSPVQGTALRFSSVYIALEAARAGRGFALAPEPLARDDLQVGRLKLASSLVLDNPFQFWIVYPAARAPMPPLQIFVDWLLQHAK